MTAKDDILREFREFNRYTGDGKPTPPTGAPLPIGDPQSGVYNPKKANLRLALGNLAQELMDGVAHVDAAIPAIDAARDAAIEQVEETRDESIAAIVPLVAQASEDADRSEAARDIAAGYASDAATAGNGWIETTAVGVAGKTLLPGVTGFSTRGYYADGDGGAAQYKQGGEAPGAIQDADGNWWELAELLPNVRQFGAKIDGVSDDTASLRSALAYAAGGTLIVPRGADGKRCGISETIIVPGGTTVSSFGSFDPRLELEDEGGGFVALGAGNPQRWTDIDGSDPADDTPMIVAGGSGVVLRDIVLDPGATPWSIGFFVPGVARCGYDRLVTLSGFTDAGVYLDQTWSDRNTALIALHPEVETAAGCIEFSGKSGYLRGIRPLRIQGTTRDPVGADVNTWQWGWGGFSDSVFSETQFRPGGSSVGTDGACIWLDAAAPGVSALAYSGLTFFRCALRSGNAPEMVRMDRVSRVEFFGGYGEAPSGLLGKWSLHSTKTTDISVHGGRYVRAPIFVDGTDSGQTMENGQGGHPSFYNSNWRGEEFAPALTRTGVGVWPRADLGASLGTASFNFASVRAALVRADRNDLTLRGATGIDFTTGGVGARRAHLSDGGAFTPGASGQFMGGTNLLWTVLANQVRMGGDGPRLVEGAGSPEGAVSAPPGSLYLNRSGGRPYSKGSGSGNVGWSILA